MIFFLALRNLLRNKRNSFLLILLITFITFVFFLGSSLIEQSIQGMRMTYVQNLTGDLVVQKKARVSMNLFGANTPIIDDFFTIPTLPAYDDIKRIISNDTDVLEFAGIVSGNAILDVNGVRAPVPLIGVDAERYFNLFPGLTINRGRKLLPGEEGIMLEEGRRKSIETQTGKPLNIGTTVLLTSVGSNSFKIREIPIVGIFSYTNPGPYMDELAITDPQTVRALSSVLSVASQHVEVSDEALGLLDDEMESLFEGEELFTDLSSDNEVDSLIDNLQQELRTEEDADEIEVWQGGDWNFLILRLKEGVPLFRVQGRLNSVLDGYDVKTVGWQTAAGNSALMVLLIQGLFYGGIILVGFAGVVTIINIILISVFKRTREMGTLRAIGFSDGYIMNLILLENACLAIVGGFTGVGSGILFLQYINSLNLTIPHAMLAALMGSPILKIDYLDRIALQSLLLAVVLGLTASLLPGWKATRINPIEAVRRG